MEGNGIAVVAKATAKELILENNVIDSLSPWQSCVEIRDFNQNKSDECLKLQCVSNTFIGLQYPIVEHTMHQIWNYASMNRFKINESNVWFKRKAFPEPDTNKEKDFPNGIKVLCERVVNEYQDSI